MDSDISNASLTTSPTVAQPVLATQRRPAQLTLIVMKGDAIYGATDYWIEGERLFYVLRSGAQGALDLDDVDWNRTLQLNAERGLTFLVRDRPRGQ